jgi:hypothetical protein
MIQDPDVVNGGPRKWSERLEAVWNLLHAEFGPYWSQVKERLDPPWAELKIMARAYDGARALFLVEGLTFTIITAVDDPEWEGAQAAFLDIAPVSNTPTDAEQARTRKAAYVLAAALELEKERASTAWSVYVYQVSTSFTWRVSLFVPGDAEVDGAQAADALRSACRALGVMEPKPTPGLIVIPCYREDHE